MTPLQSHVPITPYAGPTAPTSGELRLDGNEGRTPPDDLLRILTELNADALKAYPSTESLAAQIAARWETTADRIVVTAGADDAIDRCLRAYACGGQIVLPVPTFEMMYRFAQVANAATVQVAWDDAFPTREVIDAIGPVTGAVAIVTPNNPTGQTSRA